MARTARASVGNVCYHVINRGNAQATVYHKDDDYLAFLRLLGEANARVDMRLLAYCLMPNHFHLVVWPRADGDLSRWMQWLLTSHVRRYHRHYGTSGHVWQGRFKAFPIQSDEHLLTVMRYVERNPVRAKGVPVRKAQNWPWSSAAPVPPELTRGEAPLSLHKGPVARPADWLAWVNQACTPAELESLRRSVNRGQPYGQEAWREKTAKRLGLESSLRPRGRPRKGDK